MLNTLLLIALAIGSAAGTESTVKRIEERFVAPCCWRENLAVHRSPEADAMRAEIRALVESGKTEDEIVAFYVARHGQRILREPEGGPAVWLRAVPVAVGAVGLMVVAWFITRSLRKKPQPLPAAGVESDDVDWL